MIDKRGLSPLTMITTSSRVVRRSHILYCFQRGPVHTHRSTVSNIYSLRQAHTRHTRSPHTSCFKQTLTDINLSLVHVALSRKLIKVPLCGRITAHFSVKNRQFVCLFVVVAVVVVVVVVVVKLL